MDIIYINHKSSVNGLKRFSGMAKFIWITIVCFGFAGCGSTPVSESRYTSVQKQIKEAEDLHASKIAGGELYEAQKKFEDARKADNDGKRKKALRLLKESELHAQLAETKAMRTRAQKMLDEINKGLETLENEMSR
ncbi:DUF4398 domain-containing protein [Nitrosomonas sp.]|uniref:DUF4398 domain-containing protein n=1 Tax=Nitrosomonas sp. TaxID=42353 RepID=UPI001E14316D|nr:DUF4398 domain-containing protein [Nitrosomonas sp.]MCB1947838.1 DUF4398 domain-containing protein [Nitrosomonas sp.]MCP5243129.1 DUF4398 domain-containing protein [Burkholderiales bacterium]MDR4513849.1 DUF4398 domain-containing protein [Nitrosomonas sp.]